jgi:hypothetical protein
MKYISLLTAAAIASIPLFALLSVIPSLTSNSYAQNNQTTTSLNFTKLIEQKFTITYQGVTPEPKVHVLYQSSKSLVLYSPPKFFKELGSVVDIAKQEGYTIDAMTETIDPTIGLSSSSDPDTYTIFMSK